MWPDWSRTRITAGLRRAINVSGNEEARQTLEQHLLDGVAFSVDAAGDARVQGSVVIRQATENVEESLANPLLAALRFRDRVNCCNGSLALIELSLRDLVHPVKKGIRRVLLGGSEQGADSNPTCNGKSNNSHRASV